MPDPARNRAAVWKIRWLPMAVLLLPGTILIVASFFVHVEAMEEGDVHPLLALGIFFIMVIIGIMIVMALKSRARKRLVRNGIPGTAEVLSVEETGATVNRMPVVRLRLRVTDGSGQAREVEHKQVLSRLMVMEIERGDTLQVRVHPKRPGRLAILFGGGNGKPEGGRG